MEDKIILITHPKEKSRQFASKKWLITIGSMAGNDLVLSSEGVAAKHARLERSESGWTVVDMNSKSGTFMDNSRLLPDVPEPWPEDRQLRIGPYSLAWSDKVDEAVPDYEEPVVASVPEPSTFITADGLSLAFTASSEETAPGQPVDLLLEIKNNNAINLEFKVIVKEIPAEWVAMRRDIIRLAPQQWIKVPVTIQPPRSSQATAGRHRFEIQAKPTQASVNTATAYGQLNISSFSQTVISIEPLPLRHKQTGTIHIHNEGNTSVEYRLQAVEPGKELEFDLPQERISLGAGEMDKVPIKAKGKKRPLLIQQKVLPMALNTQSNVHTQVEKAQVIVPPLIPLGLLLLIGLLLFFLLLFIGGRTYLCQDNIIVSRDDLYNRICGVQPAVAETIPSSTPESQSEVTDISSTVVPTATESPTETPEILPPTEAPRMEATSLEIGRSVTDQPIMASKLGNGSNPVVFVAGVHAGYAPSSTKLAQDVTTYLGENPDAVPGNVTVWIIPKFNPDSDTGAGDGRVNAHGVDLNRNWQCKWDAIDGRGGDAPLSEPESQALSAFIDDQQPAAIIFWNVPVQAANQAKVSPGKCQVEQSESEDLAALYADNVAGYIAQQANLGGSVTGDITDSLADRGVASVFVLLNNQTEVSFEEHLPAVLSVLNSYDE